MKDKDLEKNENTEERIKDKAKHKIEKLEAEIEKLQSDVEHWKNEYYRAYADTKNLRSSLEKDHIEAIKYRAEGFIEGLLPVLDSFYVVLKNEPDDPNLKNYLIGFQYIYKNLVNVLESEGVQEIVPQINDKFDPHTMNAVDTVVDDENPGVVRSVNSIGYMLHSRLVRPANVVVTIKKEEAEKQNKKFDA